VSDIYQVTDDFRRRLLRQEREAAVEMTRAYARIWMRVKQEIDDLLAEWERDGGVNAGPDWVYRYNRLRKLEAQIQAELTRYTEYAEQRIETERRRAAKLGAEGALFQLGIAGEFDRLPAGAVRQVAAAILADGSPLKILLGTLPDNGAKVVGDALIQGMALGKSVREIAGDMRVALGGNLTRALRIARTETLRAYREATRATYRKMGVQQWEWRSARNERTCAVCWAMDGKRFSVDEPMPAHVNCRCVMLPVTDTWEALGAVGIDELTQQEPALERFASLRPDQQLMVLGPAKFRAYNDGVIELSDLVGWKVNPFWGKSVYERSLAELNY
jgi:SPP1 gp7 family putative phage head morphogenesis protein